MAEDRSEAVTVAVAPLASPARDSHPVTATSAKPRHHWADWAGFLAYLGMACWIFVTSRSLGVLMLPIFAVDLLIAGSFLIRRPLRAQLPGWQAQFAGYVGSFLPVVFLQVAGKWVPRWLSGQHIAWVERIGMFMWFFGLFLSLWTIVYLRRAFSLVPQARVLVTSGPYRLARHPIYLAYILQYSGIWLAGRGTLPFTLVLAAWLAITWWRTELEEQVLTQAFPEYAQYRRLVGRFLPRLWRPATTASQ